MADLILRDQLLPLPGNGREFVIGRQEDCDLRLGGKLISRRHAKLILVDRTTWIEDLGSVNGVKINGTRIPGRHALKDGELITVGEHNFQFSDPTQPVPRTAGQGPIAPTEMTFFVPAPSQAPSPPKPIPVSFPTPRPNGSLNSPGSKGFAAAPTVLTRDSRPQSPPHSTPQAIAVSPPATGSPSGHADFRPANIEPLASPPAAPSGPEALPPEPAHAVQANAGSNQTTVPERPSLPVQPGAVHPSTMDPQSPLVENPFQKPVIRWLILSVIAGILGLIIAVAEKFLLT